MQMIPKAGGGDENDKDKDNDNDDASVVNSQGSSILYRTDRYCYVLRSSQFSSVQFSSVRTTFRKVTELYYISQYSTIQYIQYIQYTSSKIQIF